MAVIFLATLEWLGGPTSALAAQSPADGRALYSEGQYAQAQEAFQSDLSAHPTSPERAFNLGAAAYKNQKWAEAIDAFGRALQTPDKTLRSRAEFNFANTLVQQARQGRRGQDNTALQQAADHYEESLRTDPGFADARTNLEFVKKLLQQPPPPQDQKQQKNSKDKNSEKEKKQNKPEDSSEPDQKDPSDSGDSGDENKEEKKQGSGKGDSKEKKSGKESGEDSKSGEESKSQDKEGQQSPENGQPQGKQEELPDQKERGELKNSPADAPDKPQPEKAGEQQQAGGTGRITREQARALLDALRSEDRRVNLWASENQKQAGKMREGKTW
jgi:hypothetical protein